jgi:hypothetical protein
MLLAAYRFRLRLIKRANTFDPLLKISHLCLVVSFLVLAGCGGSGGSGSQPPPPPSQVNSVTVTPNSVPVLTGASQLFTAQVMGTGAFDTSVTWSVNGVNGGNTTVGTIVGGEYTAPASLPSPNGVTITATSVQESASFGTATAVLYAPAVLTSIGPTAASAGEQITINGQNIVGVTEVFFSGINGTSIPMAPPQLSSNTQATVTVPFGATTGPIYATVSPYGGLIESHPTPAPDKCGI